MRFDKVNIIASIILIVIASIAYYPVVMVYADVIQEETQVSDEVTLQVTSIEEEIEDTDRIKLEHKVAITANFEGKFDREMINTSGEYRISDDVNSFVLVGNFEETGVSHYDPISGKIVISNPNCTNISAKLVLESVETKINLDYTGKNCHYGLISYVIGTFEVTDSEGKYEINEGEGRITFVADHHSNNVSGQIKGEFS